MRGEVDIIVFAEGTPRVSLVAQIRMQLGEPEREAAERQLKQYMLASHCPIGLIVTPTMTHVLVDSYESFNEDSVRETGRYNTADLLGLEIAPTDEREIRAALFRWLEQLTNGYPNVLPSSPEARTTVLENVVPAVVEGRVRSGSLG